MDLFHTQGRMSPRNPVMRAQFTEDGAARLVLIYEWDRTKPMAAWLMNNPSIAGRDGGGGDGEATFDPTARRVIHFSDMIGAGSCALLNWCPLVETKPADLWRRISAGALTDALVAQNLATIAGYAGKAQWRFVATGPEGLRRDPARFRDAVMCYCGPGDALLHLGRTDDGAPLHPLARGKHAIPNDRTPWPYALEMWRGFYA